MENTSFAK